MKPLKSKTSADTGPLHIKISSEAAKYTDHLDKPTRKRIADKIEELSKDPFNIRTSKPLSTAYRRTARIGGYRILFQILLEDKVLLVSDIGVRGQVYKRS